jgi:hypothetical protein
VPGRSEGQEKDNAPSPQAAAPRERGAGALLKLVATLVSVCTGVAALLFVLWPQLKPEEPSRQGTASLSQLRLEPNVTRAYYLARVHEPTTGYTKAQLADRGALLDVHIVVTGFKGERLPLRWQLYEASSGKKIDEERAIAITPDRTEVAGNHLFWVPLQHRRGNFFANVELLLEREHSMQQLDSAQTDRFQGLAANAP